MNAAEWRTLMGTCFWLKSWRVATVSPPHSGILSIVNPKDYWQMPLQPNFHRSFLSSKNACAISLDFNWSFLPNNVTIDSSAMRLLSRAMHYLINLLERISPSLHLNVQLGCNVRGITLCYVRLLRR